MTYRALANAPPFRLVVWRGGACHSGLRVEDSGASSGAGRGCRGVTFGQCASWRDITHGLVDPRERDVCVPWRSWAGGGGLGRASLGQCNGTGPQGRILGRCWELEPAVGSFPATTTWAWSVSLSARYSVRLWKTLEPTSLAVPPRTLEEGPRTLERGRSSRAMTDGGPFRQCVSINGGPLAGA